MLVKLAFVMQKLKKYLKIFFMINKDGGGGQFLDFMRGTQSSWGGPPQLGKTLQADTGTFTEPKNKMGPLLP